ARPPSRPAPSPPCPPRPRPPPDTAAAMQRLNTTTPLPLLGVAATRALEQNAAHGLPPHTLMARAGDAVARWARALYPHTRHLWIACGPGNNGGDGLVAAVALLPWARASGAQLSVSWCGDETRLPSD